MKVNARTKLSAQVVLRFCQKAQAQEVCLEINLGQDSALHRHYLDKNKQLDLEQQVLKDLLPESWLNLNQLLIFRIIFAEVLVHSQMY